MTLESVPVARRTFNFRFPYKLNDLQSSLATSTQSVVFQSFRLFQSLQSFRLFRSFWSFRLFLSFPHCDTHGRTGRGIRGIHVCPWRRTKTNIAVIKKGKIDKTGKKIDRKRQILFLFLNFKLENNSRMSICDLFIHYTLEL